MKGEITDIRLVYKYGAFGNANALGIWIYGKKPDGKTVACRSEKTDCEGIRIWAIWKSGECETEFSKEEWQAITKEPMREQRYKCNKILNKRVRKQP